MSAQTATIRPFPGEPHDDLTSVELTWREKRVEHWIRFGNIAHEQILDRQRRIVSFAPDAIFAFVRWASNNYGTTVSRIDIVRPVSAGEAYQTLPFVRPGGDILLKLQGWPKVERVLQIIDAVEALGIDLAEVSTDYWRQVGNRMTAGQNPHGYTVAQHRAWLLRRRAEP